MLTLQLVRRHGARSFWTGPRPVAAGRRSRLMWAGIPAATAAS